MSQTTTPSTQKLEYMRAKDAARMLMIGRSTFWAWVAAGKLPPGIHLSRRVTVWAREQLVQFVEGARNV